MKLGKPLTLALLAVALSSTFPVWSDSSARTWSASKVDTPPTVDGKVDDNAWSRASELTTHDSVAKIDIKLKAVYTDDRIFILAQYPDETENREHKTLLWDKTTRLYKLSPKREDAFVLKWNMKAMPVDLKLGATNTYKADLWFWKSVRTDHAGYADDKYQLYSKSPLPKSRKIQTEDGNNYYLLRKGDKGTSAYKGLSPIDHQGDEIVGFTFRQPKGSRADIRAKGVWREGLWTIEFSRKLQTGHSDDVQLTPGNSYLLGVSRYEIAGRAPDPSLEMPLYGSGEITEHLKLELR